MDAVYDLSKRQPGEETPQLEVLPITMYVTEYAERQFSQIAVNGRYICYGLRAGQIRVLHKETASRALLRGHTQHIADMAFSPSKNSDVLASFGMDGNLFVKKIVAPADPNGDIEEKCLLQVTVMTEALPGTVMTPKVRWLSKSKIVASYADGVFIVDVAAAAAASENTEISLYLSPGSFGAEAPDGVTIVSPMAGRPVVTDMSVGPGEAGRLAVAHHDGTLRVWSQAGDTFVQDSTFSPFDETPDAPLASVFFAAPDALVIGGEHNNQLSMWSLPIGGADDMSVSPEHVQTLSFAPSADVYNFAVSAAPGARLVLVSNLKKQALYAVHFGEDAKCGFDYVSEFSTTMPVLSFTALREDGAESDEPTTGGAGTLQLYCMQTQAIQQYALAVDRCRPVSCVGDEAVAVESSEYSSDEESEEEEEKAVPPLAAAPATPAPATPAKPAKQDSASKLLTPGALMSMAAGASNVTPTATAPKEQPAPKAKAAPKAKGAPPPPQAPPPPGGPPPHARGPPPPGPPPFHGPPHGRGPPGHGPPPHGPPPGHREGLITGLREHIYNDMAGFLAVSAADAREERYVLGLSQIPRLFYHTRLTLYFIYLRASREAAERERQKQLLTAVSAAITRDLPVAIEKILKKELGNTVPLIAAALAASSGKAGGDSDDAVAKALPAALAKAMAATVVPKFEKATNEMFQQVKSVFERGMDELAAELYTQKENAVAAEVGPLVHSLRAASDEGTYCAFPKSVNTLFYRSW